MLLTSSNLNGFCASGQAHRRNLARSTLDLNIVGEWVRVPRPNLMSYISVSKVYVTAPRYQRQARRRKAILSKAAYLDSDIEVEAEDEKS